MSDLVSCPFSHDPGDCDVPSLEWEWGSDYCPIGRRWWVECQGCGARGPLATDDESAVSKWNSRGERGRG